MTTRSNEAAVTLPRLSYDPATSALVLIDLQQGIVNQPLVPRSGPDVVHAAKRLVTALRPAGALIVRVHVGYGDDNGALPLLDVDEPAFKEPPPKGWDTFVDDARPEPGDLVITKRQWGAFYGTELDLQLRRRRRTTIILAGISTHAGVESTARAAWEHGYRLILPHDAMASRDGDAHTNSVTRIFPKIGHVCTVEDIITHVTI
jgi:nicotinamidase-related amidase